MISLSMVQEKHLRLLSTFVTENDVMQRQSQLIDSYWLSRLPRPLAANAFKGYIS